MTDIALLFARNILEEPLTREERTAIIQHYREARQRFALAPPRPVKSAGPKTPGAALKLDIDI